MNWMNDLITTLGMVFYWGSILLIILTIPSILLLAAMILCKAASRGPEFFKQNAVDRELQRMLSEGGSHESR